MEVMEDRVAEIIGFIDRLPFIGWQVGSTMLSHDVQHNVALFDTFKHLQHLRMGQVIRTLSIDEKYLVTCTFVWVMRNHWSINIINE